MSTDGPVARKDFATRDRDEAAEYIQRVYDGHRPRFGGERRGTEFRVNSAGTATLSADRVRLTMNFGVTIEPVDQLTLAVVGSGRMRMLVGRSELRIGRGDAFIYQLGTPTHVDWQDIDLAVLRVPVAPVAELAALHSGIEPADLRIESTVPVSAARARLWRGVTELVTRELHAPDPAMNNPLVAEQLLRTVSTAILATFPNTTMNAGTVRGPGEVAPAAVRRAVAFMTEHAAEPVRLAEIAAAAGLGVRALQYGFLRHYGTTPTRYLQHLRLDRAHRDLQAADPGRGDTVAAIAARWGFAKPSRFAARYRERFGHSPSHTLRT